METAPSDMDNSLKESILYLNYIGYARTYGKFAANQLKPNVFLRLLIHPGISG